MEYKLYDYDAKLSFYKNRSPNICEQQHTITTTNHDSSLQHYHQNKIEKNLLSTSCNSKKLSRNLGGRLYERISNLQQHKEFCCSQHLPIKSNSLNWSNSQLKNSWLPSQQHLAFARTSTTLIAFGNTKNVENDDDKIEVAGHAAMEFDVPQTTNNCLQQRQFSTYFKKQEEFDKIFSSPPVDIFKRILEKQSSNKVYNNKKKFCENYFLPCWQNFEHHNNNNINENLLGRKQDLQKVIFTNITNNSNIMDVDEDLFFDDELMSAACRKRTAISRNDELDDDEAGLEKRLCCNDSEEKFDYSISSDNGVDLHNEANSSIVSFIYAKSYINKIEENLFLKSKQVSKDQTVPNLQRFGFN